MSDTELLDALERFINNNGGLLIHHDGHDSQKYPGLGLRCTNRTLRKALEQAMRHDSPADNLASGKDLPTDTLPSQGGRD